MAEPRARPRTRGQLFSTPDLSDLLYAYGGTSTSHPPPTLTTTTLDEILTDFIIETCHSAALSASYSRRQKIKVEDFKWVLRKDEALLGRVLEQLWREKRMRDARKAIDVDAIGRERVGELEEVAEVGGVGGEGKTKRKRNKQKRRKEDREDQSEGK